MAESYSSDCQRHPVLVGRWWKRRRFGVGTAATADDWLQQQLVVLDRRLALAVGRDQELLHRRGSPLHEVEQRSDVQRGDTCKRWLCVTFDLLKRDYLHGCEPERLGVHSANA